MECFIEHEKTNNLITSFSISFTHLSTMSSVIDLEFPSS